MAASQPATRACSLRLAAHTHCILWRVHKGKAHISSCLYLMVRVFSIRYSIDGFYTHGSYRQARVYQLI